MPKKIPATKFQNGESEPKWITEGRIYAQRLAQQRIAMAQKQISRAYAEQMARKSELLWHTNR